MQNTIFMYVVHEFPCHISSVSENMEGEGIFVKINRTSENGPKPAGLIHFRL